MLGDIDGRFRRGVGFEDVDFSSEADEGPEAEGEFCSCFTTGWDGLIGNNW